ncbi:MAG: HPr family phosphocarrier protein [Acetobacteraceae bacterium]|nr:HPr family phosphocarrier protein [Acetobacteraceae bacterium]
MSDVTGASASSLPPAADCGCGESDMVLRRTLTIRNSRGLHARAAAKLVTLAETFSACLNVVREGQRVPACSIMGLMMLGAGKGSQITIEAEGWDAREALDAVAGLVEAGFHED